MIAPYPASACTLGLVNRLTTTPAAKLHAVAAGAIQYIETKSPRGRIETNCQRRTSSQTAPTGDIPSDGCIGKGIAYFRCPLSIH